MKKLLACVLTAVLMLSCLTACDLFEKDKNVTCQEYENCAVFTFDDFPIRETASFELERTGLGEGAIYYQVNLQEGALSINYKDTGLIHQEQPLGEFTADDVIPINGSGGYIEGNKITITFYSHSPVSGEIIIAFTENALKAVHGELKLHEHTCVYETTADAHKRIYTCDCDWLEERDFEHHFDEDSNGECDECEYYVGIPHEDHGWHYDVNETSHRQVFSCDCESPENYEAHYNNDGDDLCDACGYIMNENTTDTGKVKLRNILQRLQFEYNVEALIDKYNFYDTQDYYLIDNADDYCEFLSDIGVPYEGPFDFLFEESVMFCYLRCVSGSADFIPVEYFYDGDTNKIECKTIYQPEPDVSFPAVEICWCVDLVEVPRSIFEQLSGS